MIFTNKNKTSRILSNNFETFFIAVIMI